MDDLDALASSTWHSISPQHARHVLAVSEDGLSRQQVQQRQARFGPNALPSPRAMHFGIFLLHQLRSPLIYVLLLALVVSLLVGHLSDAVFIGAIVVFNALIGAVQEFHARRSADALRNMVSDSAMVLREGQWLQLPTQELVPGDWVELASGNRVPADLRLMRDDQLQIDESLLTGESVPVDKNSTLTLPADTPVMERQNIAFAGSLVHSGRGVGLVTQTGSDTEIGQLARGLIAAESARPPLLQRIERFSKNLTVALLVVVTTLALVELARNTPPLTVFMTVVALAVSAIPEGLPVALTVVLSVSMRRMVKQHVIVRKLVAVESLGSCTVIAADKTGTLTLNELTADAITFVDGQTWPVASSNVNTNAEQDSRLLRCARVATLCNEAKWQWDSDSRSWLANGDTVDIAFLHMSDRLGLAPAEVRMQYPQLEQIPYEPRRGFAASLHEVPHNDSADSALICVKGALETLLPMCDTMATAQGDQAIDSQLLVKLMHQQASQGARVLAVADRIGRPANSLDVDSLHSLCLLGLVAMIDPLRPEAQQAIADCQRAGIEVCILTGDHPRTASANAKRLGLISDDSQVITGAQLASAQAQHETEFDDLVHSSSVFARVTPEQKLAIVRSLIRQGEFVAVTGDGANDAPALTAAHVGVAMAKRGTDVAREAADLLVTDDNFASLVAGIREGRIAYANVRKTVFFLVSTGVAEIVLFILAAIFAMPLPLTPIQLLWLNLVTNGAQNLGLAVEPGEGDEMQKPPRSPQEGLFNSLMISRILLAGLVMGTLAFGCFSWLLQQGMTETLARSYTLLLMVLFENAQVFNSRSETRSVFSHSLWRNPLLIASVLLAQALHLGAMYWPPMAEVLGITAVSFGDWLPLLGFAALIIVTGEMQKLYYHWRNNSHYLDFHSAT